MDEAGKPLLGAGDKLLRIRTKTKPNYWQEGNVWFALNLERPLFAFAGIWADRHARYEARPVEVPHKVYGFLKTEPNAVVEPIHSKAMPVILNEDTWCEWMNAPAEQAMKLQRPWPDDRLKIVKSGVEKSDEVKTEPKEPK